MLKKYLFILLLTLLSISCQREKIVEDEHGVFKTELKNGLTVIIKENHTSELVTILTQVKVGYFNESDAQAGISHLLEHMYFKGTPKRPGPDDFGQEAKSYGAIQNAWTSYDHTGYFLTLPSRYFEQALELQADGLMHMKVDPTELSKETEIVIQEGKRKKDTPATMTDEYLKNIAFEKHRLRRWRIGQEKGLRAITRNNVLNFHNNFYKANNMVLTVVGDINAREALKAIRRYYGKFSSGVIPIETLEPEPEQTDFQYKRKWGDIKTSILAMGFHTPEKFHEDTYALKIIAALLEWGDSSRLYRAFKKKKILSPHFAVDAEDFKDTGFFSIRAKLHAQDFLNAEMTFIEELEKLKHQPVSYYELKKIQNILETRYYTHQASTMGMAKSLSAFEQHGNYRLLYDYLKKLYAVSPADIQRVAQKYFTLKNASLFEYTSRFQRPHESSKTYLKSKLQATSKYFAKIYKDKPTLIHPKQGLTVQPDFKMPSIKSTDRTKQLRRYQLSNKSILLLKEDPTLPLVTIHIYFKGGRLYEERKNSGITQLLLRASPKGTTTKSAEEISKQFDTLGARMGTTAEPDFFGYQLTVLKKNLGEALKLFADVILNPSFQKTTLDREKEIMFALKRINQDNSKRFTYTLFKEAAFKNHPYGLAKLGNKRAIQKITADHLIDWHSKSINATDMVVSIVGDFNSLDMRASIENYFKQIAPRNFDRPEISTVQLPRFISENFKERRKEQTAFLLGFQAVPENHPDTYSLKIIQALTSGVTGRFGIRLRSKEKLAYVVSSNYQSMLKGGVFSTYTAVSPQDEKKALRYLLEEIKSLRDLPVTKEELSRTKNAIIGRYHHMRQSRFHEAYLQAKNEIYGKPPISILEFPDKIKSVSVSDISSAALKYFNLESYTLGVVRGKSKEKSIISKPPKPIVIPKPKKVAPKPTLKPKSGIVLQP